jgi:hypothetical protein
LKSNNHNIKIVETLLSECDEGITTNRLVYHIPKKNIDFIKNSGYKFSEFVNMAIEEKIEKILKDNNGKK